MSESKIPTFNKSSKMRKYNLVFDEDVGQMRSAFFNSELNNMQFNEKFGDIYWTIEPGFEYRSDIISKKFYGTAKYDWIIEQVNNIKDPIKDLKVGTKLFILSITRIVSII